MVISVMLGIFLFALHSSSLFAAKVSSSSAHVQLPRIPSSISSIFNWCLNEGLIYASILIGLLMHYILPQLRSEMPWLCFVRPFFRTRERQLFEVTSKPIFLADFLLFICLIISNTYLSAKISDYTVYPS